MGLSGDQNYCPFTHKTQYSRAPSCLFYWLLCFSHGGGAAILVMGPYFLQIRFWNTLLLCCRYKNMSFVAYGNSGFRDQNSIFQGTAELGFGLSLAKALYLWSGLSSLTEDEGGSISSQIYNFLCLFIISRGSIYLNVMSRISPCTICGAQTSCNILANNLTLLSSSSHCSTCAFSVFSQAISFACTFPSFLAPWPVALDIDDLLEPPKDASHWWKYFSILAR